MKRTRRVLLACLSAAVAIGGLTPVQEAAAAPAGHPAGTYSPAFTLTTFDAVVDYDVAAASNGTAYIGWISSTGTTKLRQVHLCTLPVGATACVGGIQTIESGDQANARDLFVRVFPGNVVTLVWQNSTTNSVGHPRGDQIMRATAVNGRNLSAANAMADAPSYGELMGVERAADGTVWTLDYPGLPSTKLEIRSHWVDAPQVADAKYTIGFAQLALVAGKPYVTFQEAGKVTRPNHWGTSTNGVWRFAAIPRTWTVDTNALLTSTNYGLRMIAATNNASYRPVISAFSRGTFGPLHLTADKSSCAPQNHDGATDRSGRLLDVSYSCETVTLATYTPGLRSSILRFGSGGVPTLQPQVASGVRGIATVVWSTEPTTGTKPLRLWVRRVRVPGFTQTTVKRVTGGAVSLTGPVSCLPPVNVTVGTTSRAAKGWKLVSRSFKLGGTAHGSRFVLDGAVLKAGTRYTLTSASTFAKGSSRSRVTTAQSFTTCPTS